MLLPEVEDKLNALGLVGTGYVVVKGKLPDTPDKVIAIFETGGAPSQRFLSGSATVDQPGLMVKVRGAANDYETPRLQIERLYQSVLNWGTFVIDGVHYVGANPLQQPFPLGMDKNDRSVFDFNVLLQKELSPTP